MAILLTESFDHTTLAKKWNVAPAASLGAYGRRSTNGLGLGHLAWATSKTLPASGSTAIVGCAFASVGSGGFTPASILDIRLGGTAHVYLKYDSLGNISAYHGNNTLLGSTTSDPISPDTYLYLELKVVIHGSTGSVVVRYNGNTVLNLTNKNTQNGGSATWDGIGMNGDVSHSGVYDDFIIMDGSGAAPFNDLIGEIRVDSLRPSGVGTTAQWALTGAATHWQAVSDSTPDGDTSYVAAIDSPSIGYVDTFVMPDAPVVGGTIHAVTVNLDVKKTDFGVCTVVPVVRHSGANVDGPVAVSPTTAYENKQVFLTVNPGTGVAWTEAGFNAAEFGMKRAS